MMGFFTGRGITHETVEDFAEFIELVKNKGQMPDGAPYPTNIAFPYRVPRSNCIAGYELRGFGGFKGKAEGTNSRSGLWLADFSGGRPSRVRKVFFFECARCDGLLSAETGRAVSGAMRICIDRRQFL